MPEENQVNERLHLVKNKDLLRVALDKIATHSYFQMETELKRQNVFLKFHPSDLVSYILTDYLNHMFEDHIEELIANFFDSHSYIKKQTELAKGQEDFMAKIEQAFAESKKIKSKQVQLTKPIVRKKKVRNSFPLSDATP